MVQHYSCTCLNVKIHGEPQTEFPDGYIRVGLVNDGVQFVCRPGFISREVPLYAASATQADIFFTPDLP